MFYYNTFGCLGTIVAVGIGVATAAGMAYFFGETNFSKGIGFLVAGAALAVADLYCRLRHEKEYGWRRLTGGEFGGVHTFPTWMIGAVAIFGGITLLISNE